MKKVKVQPSNKILRTSANSLQLLNKNAHVHKIVAEDKDFIPNYATSGSNAVDLLANVLESTGTIILNPQSIIVIDCGFSMEIKKGYKALIFSKSGLATKGIVVANAPGLIDSDYRGNVKVILSNIGRESYNIKHKQKIAQMIVEPSFLISWNIVNQLSETNRGSGGLGSTGI